jgi:hypothetical protein
LNLNNLCKFFHANLYNHFDNHISSLEHNRNFQTTAHILTIKALKVARTASADMLMVILLKLEDEQNMETESLENQN